MCNCANYVRSDEDMSTKKDALSSEYKVNSQEWWEGYFGGVYGPIMMVVHRHFFLQRLRGNISIRNLLIS